MIDDRTSLETLLRVLQNEKESEIKKKKYHKAPRHTDKSSGMEKNSYESVYIIYGILFTEYMLWLSCFISNPFTAGSYAFRKNY